VTPSTKLSDSEALQQIRAWNGAMLRHPRATVVVVSPAGELDEHTAGQITIAEATGKTIAYITLPGRRHIPPAPPPTLTTITRTEDGAA
jgi:hypothetical protein